MDLLLAKVWYFCYFGGLVCVWPYINIFYRSNALNDAQIGVLAAIKPWVSAPASFFWSGIADRYSAHRIIMLATFVISTLTRTSMLSFSTFAAFMLLAVAGEFLAAPVGVMADAAVVAACKNDADYGKSRLWGAVAWGTLSAFSGAIVSKFGMHPGFAAYVGLSIPCVICAWHMEFKLGMNKQQQQQQQEHESSTLESGKQQQQQRHLKAGGKADATPNAHSAGDLDLEQQRLLDQQQQPLPGSAAAAAAGKQLSPRSSQEDDIGIIFHKDVHTLHLDNLQHKLHYEPKPLLDQDPHQQQQQQQQDFWEGLRQLLSSPAVLIFMWQATVMGFGIGVIGEFLFLFLQDLGGSESLMGLTLTVTCIAEVPAFHYQPQLLKIVTVHTMLHIVMWAYVVRLALYALLPYTATAWAVLPVELLHGLCFGCGWSAGTITSKRVAPPGLEATMQGIFQGLYFGLGQGLGALIGGLLKNKLGGQTMFALCSLMCLVGWLVCVLAEHLTGTVHATDVDSKEGGCTGFDGSSSSSNNNRSSLDRQSDVAMPVVSSNAAPVEIACARRKSTDLQPQQQQQQQQSLLQLSQQHWLQQQQQKGQLGQPEGLGNKVRKASAAAANFAGKFKFKLSNKLKDTATELKNGSQHKHSPADGFLSKLRHNKYAELGSKDGVVGMLPGSPSAVSPQSKRSLFW